LERKKKTVATQLLIWFGGRGKKRCHLSKTRGRQDEIGVRGNHAEHGEAGAKKKTFKKNLRYFRILERKTAALVSKKGVVGAKGQMPVSGGTPRRLKGGSLNGGEPARRAGREEGNAVGPSRTKKEKRVGRKENRVSRDEMIGELIGRGGRFSPSCRRKLRIRGRRRKKRRGEKRDDRRKKREKKKSRLL